MSETMGLALLAGTVVVILLQVAVLLRGNRRQDQQESEARFRGLQEAYDKGLMRLERELREELARGRREDAEESFRDREERAQSANLLSQAVTTQVGQFGTLQAERLEAFARELNRFSLGLDERFERLKMAVEGRLAAIQADNANKLEEMRIELYEKVNALGIGAQGLGGLTTVLDVKIMDYPTHAASLPVCMIPNCAATRHAHFVLDGSGPASLEAPPLDAYPEIVWEAGPSARRVNLDTLTPEEVQSWKPGETVLLNGKMLTGRDAAHKRMVDMLNKGEELPVDLKGRFIYYVGPVDPVRDEVVGPAGPTTATRMDTCCAAWKRLIRAPAWCMPGETPPAKCLNWTSPPWCARTRASTSSRTPSSKISSCGTATSPASAC